jgi:hypothetical protein
MMRGGEDPDTRVAQTATGFGSIAVVRDSIIGRPESFWATE